MRVFVTGASGYIGGAIVAELVARGHHVAGLARSDAAAAAVHGLGAKVVHGSLDALDVVELATRDHDALVLAAGITSPDDVARESKIIDMLERLPSGMHAVAYTSGAWVYGDRGDAVVDEDAPLAPLPLVAWRVGHEQRILGLAQHGVRPIVIRPTVVYGDGGGMVGNLIRQGAAGPVRVVADGHNRWSFVRVDALAELYVAALEQPRAQGVYNGVRGAAVPYVEVARAASRAGGGDGSVEHLTIEAARRVMGPFADALALDLQVASPRAERELGWAPHRPTVLEELANTVVP
jgi:nucleoside-diphosphate-sugar epimerase